MSIEYLGLSEINGPLIVLEGVRDAFERHGVEMTYDHLNVHIVEK